MQNSYGPNSRSKGLKLAHNTLESNASLTVSLQPRLHSLPDALHRPEHRHLAAILRATCCGSSWVEQKLEAVRPYVSLPVSLETFADLVASTRLAESALIASYSLDVFAEEKRVDRARETVIIDLPCPWSTLTHLGAVLCTGLPVGDKLNLRHKSTHVNTATKVNEYNTTR
ncbi:hypothetical protein HG530_012890 [Fusarium avenaceum]|nr:hypothetical protein HG530_012890 [Fusarium avenaceum]